MLRLIASTLLCLALTGCATVNQMAFDKKSTSIDTREKSVVLMTVDVSRSDGSRFVPEPFVVKLARPNAQSKEERQNFKLDKDVDAVQENGHSIYLVRASLAPGEYKLQEVMGLAKGFPIMGTFIVPLNTDLKVKPGSIVYIGRIKATLRDRVGNEFRAGPLLPLLDQSVAGMSGGTWDVTYENLADKDIGLFRAAYPVLGNVNVETAPLPAFDRAAAQRQWEGEEKDVPKEVAAK
ncbi:hypothetical protein [Herbaspirillum sp. SJZ107]|uniref:hypothetical protein n=1 Tax=Herbaspirillum sp. SJZ107 TaxID=2572881 RepID=UPI001154DF5F|nr:hypothetical protein [Herbaspirillum sp. SJZ107]TQK04753.1 hypothetical protein FBX97_3715 [Herbaspirillum sp. SJZ107]